ncbi:unannotated protein [freshwater metagenome]|uniref:Unannotated protein n=1 Tax=freshwater metagenome TaxID=449393 RepID=A0A6J6H7R5_9ZZZZ
MTTSADPNPLPAGSGRRAKFAVALFVLAGLCASFSVASFWSLNELLDEDTWASTSKALVDDPIVQQDVARTIAEQVVSAADVKNRIDAALPFKIGGLSTSITETATDLITQATVQVVKTDAFVAVWDAATRSAHDEFIRAVDGKQRFTTIGSNGLYLDLGSSLAEVRRYLDDQGITWLDGVDLGSIDVRVLLVDAPGLDLVRRLVEMMRVLVIILPTLAVISLGLGLLLSFRPLRALVWIGSGVIAGSVAIIVIEQMAKSSIVDELTGGVLGRASAEVIVDHVSSSLDRMLLLVVGGGVVLVVVGLLGSLVPFRQSPESPADTVAT